MLDHDTAFTRLLWPALASIAGAITALSFRPFAKMTKGEVAMSLFVGASFAYFVGPWAVSLFFSTDDADVRKLGGLFYIMATGSNVLIPMAIKKLGQFLNVKEDES